MAIASQKYLGSQGIWALAAALNSDERVLGVLVDLDVNAPDTVASFNTLNAAPAGALLVSGRDEPPPLGAALVLFGKAIVEQRLLAVSVFRKIDLASTAEDWPAGVKFGEHSPDLGITGPARL